MNEAYLKFIQGKSSLNLGSIYESVAVQQLLINGYVAYYHKFNLTDKLNNKDKKYELDLVTEINFKTTISEIKSNKNYTTSSLDHSKEKYPQLKLNRYVFGIKNIKYEDNKITLPIYFILIISFNIQCFFLYKNQIIKY